MRVSRDTAEKNRKRVVETAARLFREQGYDGIGVAGLMQAAGLTHGGFYKQFKDKEDLAVEATEAALAETQSRWQRKIARDGNDLGSLKRWYLSKPHVSGVGDGCAFAALAAEAPRHGPDLRQAFGAAVESYLDMITEGEDAPDRAEALRAMATMVGALILSRAVEDPALAEEILDSGAGPGTD